MKNIGILTYHSVCNFGANLQALSTVGYLKKHGFEPIVINWVPDAVEQQYIRSVPHDQYLAHEQFVRDHLPTTSRCTTESEIVQQIRSHSIAAVIIGSDAVAQHKSMLSRVYFPTRTLLTIAPPAPPHLLFPSPFWGSFTDSFEGRIPAIMMSVSSQNEQYIGIQGNVREEMYNKIKSMPYISVRDQWTQMMFKHISRGRIVPPITPDPVFSFNQNAGECILPREELTNKYNLSSSYILLSFVEERSVTKDWLLKFNQIANKNGYECVLLPMPKGHVFNSLPGLREIALPLSPLDWYGLIKYSSAYIGHNMHPMVVAMHNNVPFYIFDYYGIVHLRVYTNSKSSKIYDILKMADLLEQRSRDVGPFCSPPEPQKVFNSIRELGKDAGVQTAFSEAILKEYKAMMTTISCIIDSNSR
jgi:hypothetical protein